MSTLPPPNPKTMPKRNPRLLLGMLASTFAGGIILSITSFYVYTKHCNFEPMDGTNDPLIRTTIYSTYNPNSNPPFYDLCVRRIPLRFVRPDLLRDAEQGGSKLVEAFVQGIWGGRGYAIQRAYLEYKYRSDRTKHQIWDKSSLLTSTYEPGTEVTDHFNVLSKTPSSIVFRCGESPLNSPGAPREMDGMLEFSAEANLDKGYAEFRLKSLFYVGLEKLPPGSKPPMTGFVDWAHKQYTKLLVQSAVSHVQREWGKETKEFIKTLHG